MAQAISSKLGIIRVQKICEDDNITCRCSFSFILPHFEYFSPVWLPAADTHLTLIDHSFNSFKFLLPYLNLDIRHQPVIGAP